MKAPKYLWMTFDWRSAELFVLCTMTKDENLRIALLQPDPHAYMAKEIFNLAELPSKESRERKAIKLLNYALIYSSFQVDMTISSVNRENPELSKEFLAECMESYQKKYSSLFRVLSEDKVVESLETRGMCTYLMGAKKSVDYPDYVRDPDVARKSKQYSLYLSTLGQNSVGLLLKTVLSCMWRDPMVRENVSQIVPVFDALYFLVPTDKALEIQRRVESFATPTLVNGDFHLRMRTEWGASKKSWGEMTTIPNPAEVPSIRDVPVFGV